MLYQLILTPFQHLWILYIRYQAVRSSVMYSIDYTHIKEAVDEYFEAGVKLLGYFKSRSE